MRTVRDTQRSSQGTRATAKTEGKIEGDGTCVRREWGLHGGWDSTRARTRVPSIKATSHRTSKFCVPSARSYSRARWNAHDG
jgi:hypothetical protein